MARALRILIFAGALSAVGAIGAVETAGTADALPVPAPVRPPRAILAEPVQAFCGPYRCFARPFWRYRSGAGFLPFRRFGFAPPPPRFAPFGFRRFGGGFGGRFGGRFGGGYGGFRRF